MIMMQPEVEKTQKIIGTWLHELLQGSSQQCLGGEASLTRFLRLTTSEELLREKKKKNAAMSLAGLLFTHCTASEFTEGC